VELNEQVENNLVDTTLPPSIYIYSKYRLFEHKYDFSFKCRCLQYLSLFCLQRERKGVTMHQSR